MRPELFVGVYRNIFTYIQQHIADYGEMPTKEVIKRYFPTAELPTRKKVKNISLDWWCNELKRKATHNRIADAVEKIFEHLEDKEPEKAKKIMEATLRDINRVATTTKDLDLTKAAQVLKEEYKRVSKTGGMVGLPTLIKSLDRCLGGLDKEQVITIIARTNQGKTWFLLILLYNIWKQGFTVLLGTKEMSERQLGIRLASLHTKIPHSRLRLGLLTKEQKKKYFKALDELSKAKNPFIIFYIDGGVSYLRSKIEQYKPDVLGIDGVYLIEDETGSDSDWARVSNISRAIKSLAQRAKIPIIGTSQANRATSRKTGPEIDNISYSDAIAQDSDVVIGLNQTEEMRNDRELEVRVLKARDSERGNLMITWDFQAMEFEEIYSNLESEIPRESYSKEQRERGGEPSKGRVAKVKTVQELIAEKKKSGEMYGKPPKTKQKKVG